jgi:hypothetical protein
MNVITGVSDTGDKLFDGVILVISIVKFRSVISVHNRFFPIFLRSRKKNIMKQDSFL